MRQDSHLKSAFGDSEPRLLAPAQVNQSLPGFLVFASSVVTVLVARQVARMDDRYYYQVQVVQASDHGT